MEQKLLSKKELLQRYGISYGALYRWKRKGLIPEDWFIKKSTVTGQETFFPEALICQRVELILNQKDEYSLDDLSKQLHRDTQKNALIIQTTFGEKTFLLSEITALYYDSGDGTRLDVTKAIKDLCK